jgi:hypothetical protein
VYVSSAAMALMTLDNMLAGGGSGAGLG